MSMQNKLSAVSKSCAVEPSSRHGVVGDGPRAVPCDPEVFDFHPVHPFILHILIMI